MHVSVLGLGYLMTYLKCLCVDVPRCHTSFKKTSIRTRDWVKTAMADPEFPVGGANLVGGTNSQFEQCTVIDDRALVVDQISGDILQIKLN